MRPGSDLDCRGRKQFLDRHTAIRQSLFMHVLGNGFDHPARGLDAIGFGVCLQTGLPRWIDQAGIEIGLHGFCGDTLDILLGFHEGMEQIQGKPGVPLIEFALDDDGVIDRIDAGLCEIPPHLRLFVPEKRLDDFDPVQVQRASGVSCHQGSFR